MFSFAIRREIKYAEAVSQTFDVVVIGAGAAGLVAAIGAGRQGAAVAVCDRMPRPGKKILATGGGRCNLLNENLDPGAFTSTSPDLIVSVFDRFGKEDILVFFRDLGLETYSEGGRVFPVTQQAASVLKVLELEMRRLRAAVEIDFDVVRIERIGSSFSVIAADGRKIAAAAVILAPGGKAYPALGSNGSGYQLAKEFGHRIIVPIPSAVPVLVKDKMCHLLQGQKVRVRATARIGGKIAGTAEGEVLFTRYGLSGTAVLDVSEQLSSAIHREQRTDAVIALDLVPFLTEDALAAKFRQRIKQGWRGTDLAAGILPEKFASVFGEVLSEGRQRIEEAPAVLAAAFKEKIFPVWGTRGWNEAEFTSGGVDAREIDPRRLESKLQKGLFLAGEVLDVQGRRGGYNLAWAWASGFISGQESVR